MTAHSPTGVHRTVVTRLALLGALIVMMLAAFGSQHFDLGRTRKIAVVGGQGYRLLGKDGGVFNFGDAPFLGPNLNSGNDIVGIAATPTLNGYWAVDDDGSVFTYGDAPYLGGRVSSFNDITGFAARPQGDGYWMVTANGQITAKGAAGNFGSPPRILNQPILGMASTPTGNGYWLVASDGGIFAFGDAAFYGSEGGGPLNKPIAGMASTPSGHGYWLVASDGGIFSHGDAAFYGSTGAAPPSSGVTGMARTTTGDGYWLVAGNGKVYNFGAATHYGDLSGASLNQPIVAIIVTPQIRGNTLPVAAGDSASTSEDSPVTVDVLGNDSGLDDGPVSVSITGAPAHGGASVGSDRRITYVPSANYNGSDSITYKITDSDGESSTGVLNVTVTAVNDRPVANGQSVTTNEDTAKLGSVSGGDTDGDALTYSLAAGPTKGSLVLSSSGAFTYAPFLDANGADSFTFRANDGTVSSITATVNLTINPVNDAPIATAGVLAADEDVTTAGTLAATDVDGNVLTYTIVAIPTQGTVALTAGNGYAYTSNANISGVDSFSFKANDGSVDSNVVVVDVTIAAVNDAPTFGLTVSGQTIDEDNDTGVLAFSIADIETLAADLTVTASSSSTALVPNDPLNLILGGAGANHSIKVHPVANGNGSSIITLSVSDGGLATPSTFTVTVNEVNDMPTLTGVGTTYTMSEDIPAVIALTVDDIESPESSLVLEVGSTNPGLFPAGSVVLGGSDADRTLGLSPALDQSGTAVISLAMSDPQGGLFSQLVTVTVTAVNDIPVADADVLTTVEDNAGSGTVTGSDPIEGSTVTYSVATGPSSGILTGGLAAGTSGAYTYTPNPNTNGTDTFTFRTHDGTDASLPATVTITVTAVNDLPTITLVVDQTIDEDGNTGALTFTVGDVETALGSLTVSGSSDNTELVPDANIVFGGSGASRTVTATPVANGFGSALITLTVGDGTATTPTSFTLTVTAVNDQPTLADIDPQTMIEDGSPLGVAFTAADVETALGSLVVTASSDNAVLLPAGALVVSGNNLLTVDPAVNAFGTATVLVNINDTTGGSIQKSFLLTVAADNDIPVANDAAFSTNEDTPTTGTLTGSDVEGAVTYTIVAGPSNGSLSGVNVTPGAYTYTPNADYFGSDSFTFKTTDANLVDSPSATVSIAVTSQNDLPTVSTVTTQTVNEDAATGALAFTIGDGETAAGTLTMSGSSNNTTLVPNANIVFGGNGASRTVTVTPAANANGSATITMTVADGDGGSTPTTFTLNVTAVNDLPTVSTIGNQSMDEDGTLPINFTVGDAENDSLSITPGSSNPTLLPAGTITLSGTGSDRTLTIVPAPNLSGTATVFLDVSDGIGATVHQSFLLTVNAVNDAPVIAYGASSTSVQVAEDDLVGVAGTIVASDIDSVTLTYSVPVGPAGGTVSGLGANDGSFVYTPNANRDTDDSFTVSVTDGSLTDTIPVTVDIVPSDDDPVILDSSDVTPSGNEESLISGDTDASDPDTLDSLTYTVPALSANGGALTINGTTGEYTYTGPLDFVGTDTFTVTVSDAAAPSATSPVTVTVNNTNDAPAFTGTGNSGSGDEETAITGTVLANDIDAASGDSVAYSVAPANDGTNGIGSVDAGTGVWSYTGGLNFVGQDTFIITATDESSATATITVTVTVVDEVPVAVNDAAGPFSEDSSANIIDVVANDTNLGDGVPYGPDSGVYLVNGAGTMVGAGPMATTHGSVNYAPAGDRNLLHYTPSANFNGTDTFRYRLIDSDGSISNIATVTVTVTAVNDTPVAADGSRSTATNTAITDGQATATDADSDSLTYVVVGSPAHGAVIMTAAGAFTYTPNPDYIGPDSFTFKANDGTTDSNTATSSITVV